MTDMTLEEIIGAALSAPSTWPVLTGSERVVKALTDAGYIISRPMTIGDGGSALFQKIAEDAVAKAVPPGKVIVDREPSDEQIDRARERDGNQFPRSVYANAYRAMTTNTGS